MDTPPCPSHSVISRSELQCFCELIQLQIGKLASNAVAASVLLDELCDAVRMYSTSDSGNELATDLAIRHINERRDEIAASIVRSATLKRAALEEELVSADAALQRMMGNDETSVESTTLQSEIISKFGYPPLLPVESGTLKLILAPHADEATLQTMMMSRLARKDVDASTCTIASVCAPRGLKPCNVSLCVAANHSAYVFVGSTIMLYAIINAIFVSDSEPRDSVECRSAELLSAAEYLSLRVRVAASLSAVSLPMSSTVLHMTPVCGVNASGDGVTVNICVPPILPPGLWVVNVTRVSLGGHNFALGDLLADIHILRPHTHSRKCNHAPASKGEVYAAAARRDAPGLQTALDRRGSTEEADDDGNTAFIMACRNGNLATVRVLVAAGANIMAADKHGSTAFHCAAMRGHVQVVTEMMKDSRVDANATTRDGYTAFHFAAMYGHIQVVTEMMKDSRVDVNANPTLDGFTAFHWAAVNGRIQALAEMMKDSRVDVNAKANYGRTALALAKKERQAAVVALLEADPRVSR